MPAEGLIANQQQSFWMQSGWGVISEPSSLLKVSGWQGGSEVRTLQNGQVHLQAELPPHGSAPAYYVFGNAPNIAKRSGEFSFELISNDLRNTRKIINLDVHMRALRYFMRIIPAADRRPISHLRLVLLEVSRAQKGIGGAAGYDTLLINHVRDKDQPTAAEARMPQLIALHEQFHQLLSARLPLWANESLAHFYAFKALRRDRRTQGTIAQIWKRCCSMTLEAEPGLLKVQREVTNDQRFANYGLLYNKGVAFWDALDTRLQNATGGDRDLDDVLPLLLKDGFDDQGIPTDAFRKAFKPLKDDDLRDLIERYLGGTDRGSGSVPTSVESVGVE